MGKISDKTLEDLEYLDILERIASFSQSGLSKTEILALRPIQNKPDALLALKKTNEYLSALQSDNIFPNHQLENTTAAIKLLHIENSVLSTEAFIQISNNTERMNEVIDFLNTHQENLPTLFSTLGQIEKNKQINAYIFEIFNTDHSIKNNASPELKQIRKDKNKLQGQVAQAFQGELSRYAQNDYLDEIRESVIDDQRVLAVKAMYRRKVNGLLMGTSKSGGIYYIVPTRAHEIHQQVQVLKAEEKEEINRILKALTQRISPYAPLIQIQLDGLVQLDVIAAKAKYAKDINALLPDIRKERVLDFREAYHPLLLEKNRKAALEIIPQTIKLTAEKQIIVISGPNAGGKSITLKTFGLLQCMLQTGILIPVHEKSSTCFFEHILTDIGDNQSIENELSTYSYRLKNMRNFLKKCNEKTLFLIDEFGTGSDPELGGALAEIFLEEFYSKKAFGVITTHYANLKVLADELDGVENANMQFNPRTLEPLYKLHIGQAGSSFTFEVAQKMGIPFNLINRAKKKVEKEKLRLDKTISKLQQERNSLLKSNQALDKAQKKAEAHSESLNEKEEKIKEKLSHFQELYDNNQKMLSFGRKTNELMNRYFQNNNKKELIGDFIKWATAEKTKNIKLNPPVKTKKEKQTLKKEAENKAFQIKKVESEVLAKVKEVRKEKKAEEKKAAVARANYVYKINDRVRLIDSNSSGTIEKIEGKKITINYGMFTTQTTKEKIELVQAAKKG